MSRVLGVVLPLFVVCAVVAGAVPDDAPAPAREDRACFQAKTTLEYFVAHLERGCDEDADCAAYYLSPDPCAPPAVLSEDAVARVSEETLARLQAGVRAACAPVGTCEAAQAIPACRAGICVDVARDGATGSAR